MGSLATPLSVQTEPQAQLVAEWLCVEGWGVERLPTPGLTLASLYLWNLPHKHSIVTGESFLQALDGSMPVKQTMYFLIPSLCVS